MKRKLFLAPAFLIAALLAAPFGAAAQDRDAETLIQELARADRRERPEIVHRLIELGPEALDQVRTARDEASDPEVRGSLDKAATWLLASRIIPVLEKGLESQLLFDGQYSALEEYGEEGVEALFAIIDDSATGIAVRITACRALADVADRSIVPRVRELQNDILLPQSIREQLGILLAIFDDTHAVEKDIREYERYAQHEQIGVRLSALVQLSNLYYRIRHYRKAVEQYEEILGIYRDVVRFQEERGADEKLMAVLRRELALHYYNAACSNALYGDIEKAKEYLRQAVRRDPLHFENMEKDGDLRKLRADPSYAAFREELGKLFEGKDL